MPFSNAEIGFGAVSADHRLGEFLSTPQGSALFQMERTTWFQSQPVTFVRMTYHAGYRMQSNRPLGTAV